MLFTVLLQLSLHCKVTLGKMFVGKMWVNGVCNLLGPCINGFSMQLQLECTWLLTLCPTFDDNGIST